MLDLDTFGAFFEEHVEELRRGGLKSLKNSSSNANAVNAAAITETLEPIANLATVCSRDGDKSFPRDDVVALFNRYICSEYSVKNTFNMHKLFKIPLISLSHTLKYILPTQLWYRRPTFSPCSIQLQPRYDKSTTDRKIGHHVQTVRKRE